MNDWVGIIYTELYRQILRQLTDLVDPATGKAKHSPSHANAWKMWSVLDFFKDLIAAVEIPMVAGLPFVGALAIPFEDRLLDSSYYEICQRHPLYSI